MPDAISYFCRLCWNTNQWKSPIKRELKVRRTTKDRIPFVDEFGFGYEEWLNRPDWVIDGKRYAFLQPVRPSLRSKLRETLHLVLHTRDPLGRVLLVGSIRGVQVLRREEAENALATFRANGWLSTMAEEIKRIGGNHHQFLMKQDPREKFNASFRPENFQLLAKPILLPLDHQLYSWPRYQLYEIGPADAVATLFPRLTTT